MADMNSNLSKPWRGLSVTESGNERPLYGEVSKAIEPVTA